MPEHVDQFVTRLTRSQRYEGGQILYHFAVTCERCGESVFSEDITIKLMAGDRSLKALAEHLEDCRALPSCDRRDCRLMRHLPGECMYTALINDEKSR